MRDSELRAAPRTLAAVAVLSALGCGDLPADSSPHGTDLETVLAVSSALNGDIDGPTEYIFGRISALSVAADGTIYVADQQGSTVRAFDPAGGFLGTVGSEGRGPGEFFWPGDLTFDPDGRLWVRDIYRLTILVRRSEASFADSVVLTIPTAAFGTSSSDRGQTDGARYFYPAGEYGPDPRFYYLVVDDQGAISDTAHVPPLRNISHLRPALVRMGSSDFRMLPGLNRAPFEPVGTWSVAATGAVTASSGGRHEVLEVSLAGDTSWIHRAPDSARKIPAAEYSDSAAAFQLRLDSLPVPLADVVSMSDLARAGRPPTTFPEVIAVHALEQGAWLRLWPESETSQSLFEIVDRDGHATALVKVPAELATDPPPFVSDRVVAGVVRDPSTGVERVAVFLLER